MVKVGPVHSYLIWSRAQLHKDLLAIFAAFNTWRHYLESPHHTIDAITDHKNRQRCLRVVKLAGRDERISTLKRVIGTMR